MNEKPNFHPSAHPVLSRPDALSAQTLERHFEARRNHVLNALAKRIEAESILLAEKTAADVALSMAEDARHFEGADPVQWLLQELAHVQAARAKAEEGIRRMKERGRQRTNRKTPLQTAVSQKLTALVREHEVLSDHLHLLKRQDGAIGELSPAHHLKLAGLSAKQLAALEGLGGLDPRADEIARIEARLIEVAPQIEALKAWGESKGIQTHQLEGLGFDPLLIKAAETRDEVKAP